MLFSSNIKTPYSSIFFFRSFVLIFGENWHNGSVLLTLSHSLSVESPSTISLPPSEYIEAQCSFFITLSHSNFVPTLTLRFFGDQRVERLDLCSMLKKKQQTGYYHTETSLQLG